jgi:acetyl-CoA carboxylase carboxyltransferase component
LATKYQNPQIPFFSAAQGLRAWRNRDVRGDCFAATFTVAWPTGEFGPMALEGAVKLGYRNELAAISEPSECGKRSVEMVA